MQPRDPTPETIDHVLLCEEMDGECEECSAAIEEETLLLESLFWWPVDEHGAVYGGEA